MAGQALMAASMSVHDLNPSFLLHSFHCYFIGPMRTTPEVIYRVTQVKEGKNFCSVSVVAVQSDKVCFHCLVSFQKPCRSMSGTIAANSCQQSHIQVTLHLFTTCMLCSQINRYQGHKYCMKVLTSPMSLALQA